ncbi:MAG: transporter [Omnitrophica WOR_2 bacterium GWF2_38_59]|nr:MAG: transporter [Omnitrophica WOR_2 bacterium GWF2_38_59]OGX50170.1 MAG: transporter [Omnitrophica WOR_2 bacterium RIFOXYA2_FULL_38_17]OGX52796.1 MAG: transporter [Omnitrophica WOR_2 bacterium RIFOXYA12_FULL_38_10]OGX57484.1 MAG: transporter [Omnitrophica WOR_2 bacterium RIFOXYC2_FULL_38_12]OGX59191.1 MAG: transporter [Omnitrophica WOR_2 bacterium RIFOXYB2_FULL_38_16]HBG60487.1 sodium-dependent transporter [Candidatus Omnitrophota bacterium]
MERSRWSSKLIFLFAAIGSAVGMGNVWRFPYLAGKYGGGAFLIPYLIMLGVMGIPLLIMEFAIGQKMQLGAVGAFGNIKKKLASIGLGAVLCGFVVVSYYAVVMAWSLMYLVYSFTLKWGTDTKAFFFNDVLHLSNGVGTMGYISVPIIFSLIIIWLLVYFSVWKGVKSVGNVVIVTMPLPVILLIVLLIRGITLPGAMNGIIFYLKPNFIALLDFEVWSAAMSQIFFTLTLAFGVMIAYASFQHESSDIAKSAIITSVADSSISIVAGFAVFSTLGYMSLKSGVPVSELAASGPSLAFIVFPKALSLVPMAPLFAVLFFIMLITLGIDSAFSLVEAVSTVLHDNYPEIRREDVSMYVCVFGFIAGIIFSTFAGLYYLDITDHFITNYGLVGIGLLEVIAVGWIYKAENLRKYINEVSDIKIGKWWNILIKFIIPVILSLLLVTGIYRDIKTPYEGYPQWALFTFGWLMLAAVFTISYIFSLFSNDK